MMQRADKAKGKAGRPARISRASIAEAALDIGLDSATVVSIAERLRVDHSSLYRHIKDRDDILTAAIDLAVGRVDWTPSAENWRELVQVSAEAAWSMYEHHPGLAEGIRALETTPPSIVSAFAAMSCGLERFGFKTLDAILVIDTVMDMTCDAAVGARRVRQKSQKGGTVEEAMRKSWQGSNPLSDEMRIGAAMWEVYSSDLKGWWRRKLAIVIDGAAGMVEAQSA